MRVSDVADAFMLIPLAPWLWPFFLFKCEVDGWVWRLTLANVSDAEVLFLVCETGPTQRPPRAIPRDPSPTTTKNDSRRH
jgi:hypothetical protein